MLLRGIGKEVRFVKIKIKTNLWTGIIFGLFAIFRFLMMEKEVRIPMFDSGAPSPRIMPTIFLTIILICSALLIIQSVVFKKEKVVEFDWSKEMPMFVLIAMLCLYTFLIINVGYMVASLIVFPVVLFFVGERKIPVYVVSVVAAIGIYFLFKFVFNISLPDFPFFG